MARDIESHRGRWVPIDEAEDRIVASSESHLHLYELLREIDHGPVDFGSHY